jgi:hypothetical protein
VFVCVRALDSYVFLTLLVANAVETEVCVELELLLVGVYISGFML